MKIIVGSFLIFSGIFSAQTTLVEPLKSDSLDLQKFNSPIVKETEQASSDSAIAKLYKIPNAKPVNPEMYTILKAPVKNNDHFKILNSFDSKNSKKIKKLANK